MTLRLEGGGPSQLVQLMKHFGYNKDIDMVYGTVVGAPPSLRVKVDNMSLVLDNSDLVVAEHLTKHTRSVKIGGGAVQTMEFQDELEVNDRVVLAELVGSQIYIVLDRVVSY